MNQSQPSSRPTPSCVEAPSGATHDEDHGVDHFGNPHDERHDRGLEFDVATLLGRRGILGLFGALGAGAALAACGTSTDSSSASSSSARSASGATPKAEVPDETGGPSPGDGSNGPNVLDDSGIVRSDITSSFGSSTTRAEGVPLTINLTVTAAGNGNSAMEGAAVYLWHCNRDGQYSMYSQGVEDQNSLRGVQATNKAGTATYTSIYPAAYDGRWPHIHLRGVLLRGRGHQAAARSSRPHRSRSPRPPATRSMRPPATRPAWRTSPAPH